MRWGDKVLMNANE